MEVSPLPKVFISYAWESEEHRAWVKALADHLLTDGIEAIVDRYDLGLGDRLPQFMEESVTSADYVLIVLHSDLQGEGGRPRWWRGL